MVSGWFLLGVGQLAVTKRSPLFSAISSNRIAPDAEALEAGGAWELQISSGRKQKSPAAAAVLPMNCLLSIKRLTLGASARRSAGLGILNHLRFSWKQRRGELPTA